MSSFISQIFAILPRSHMMGLLINVVEIFCEFAPDGSIANAKLTNSQKMFILQYVVMLSRVEK